MSSFTDQRDADVLAVFLNEDEFAEAISFQRLPAAGSVTKPSAEAITGLREESLGGGLGGYYATSDAEESWAATWYVAASQLAAAPDRGDSLTDSDGVVWNVFDIYIPQQGIYKLATMSLQKK